MAGASRIQKGQVSDKRYLLKFCFSRELHNGEFVNREWSLYSPSTGSVFCSACTLFSITHSNFSTFRFDDWKKVSKHISGHEKAPNITEICSLTPVGKKKGVSLTLYY